MTNIQKGLLRNRKLFKAFLLAVFILLAVGAGAFFWLQQHKDVSSAPNKDTNEQTSVRILRKVSKIYALPKNEEPSVAAIEDSSKLADQNFFAKAQDGDYLLVYPEAKLALIYREQAGQLINVGPISEETSQ